MVSQKRTEWKLSGSHSMVLKLLLIRRLVPKQLPRRPKACNKFARARKRFFQTCSSLAGFGAVSSKLLNARSACFGVVGSVGRRLSTSPAPVGHMVSQPFTPTMFAVLVEPFGKLAMLRQQRPVLKKVITKELKAEVCLSCRGLSRELRR